MVVFIFQLEKIGNLGLAELNIRGLREVITCLRVADCATGVIVAVVVLGYQLLVSVVLIGP